MSYIQILDRRATLAMTNNMLAMTDVVIAMKVKMRWTAALRSQ